MAIILYARQSVERENSISCDTQLEYCKSMLRPDERDAELITLVDNGFSGGNVNRDGFQQLMRLVRQGSVSKVIVYKVDRLSRSLVDFVSTLQEFKAQGVQFLSSQEAFDTSTPYGELILKILIVFAEFERSSIINRITQAYEHRSDMGFYMGGQRPFGFELLPTMIHGVHTKKLSPRADEAELVRRLYQVYAGENVSLRQLQKRLASETQSSRRWSSSKLSALLKNPIYVRADAAVYDYFERRGVQIKAEPSLFTGVWGAQLYGRSKHDPKDPDWSDMKLVLLQHEGLVDSDLWLSCQRKLEANRQIGSSFSNGTSWLAGSVYCQLCGRKMTTIKGKANRRGDVRRYFYCCGKSQHCCSGPDVSVYAEELEQLLFDCISEKLAALKSFQAPQHSSFDIVNDFKLKLKVVEQSEKQLMERLLSADFNEELTELANRKAAQLKQQRLALCQRLEALETENRPVAVDLVCRWNSADYEHKKAAALLLIHRIFICGNGDVQIIWNI